MDSRRRAMLEDAFTPEASESYKPMMRDVINKTLDKMINDGCKEPVNLIDAFATPVPTQVSLQGCNLDLTDLVKIIYKILGVPDEDVESLSQDKEVKSSTSRNAAETSNR